MNPFFAIERAFHHLPLSMVAAYGLITGLALGAGYDYFKFKSRNRGRGRRSR